MSLDKEIFSGKTLSDLCKEIYDNSRKKDKQISALIVELKELIEGIDDATLVVPMIKEYLEIGVKNDEHLIKLATVIQRLESKASTDTEMFDPAELMGLLEEVENNSVKNQDKDSTEDGK